MSLDVAPADKKLEQNADTAGSIKTDLDNVKKSNEVSNEPSKDEPNSEKAKAK